MPPQPAPYTRICSRIVKILLVKLSSLGDVVHTLPVVQDIRAAWPQAQIDWVVERSFASLLARNAGLRRVIACDIRRWSKSPLAGSTRREWRAFRQQLQLEAYDAVIDLQGLTKSAVVARLARLAPGGKRFAMANQTDGSGYEAPTRWLADVAIRMEPHSHAVQRGRMLAAAALGYDFAKEPDFGLNTPLAPIQRASKAIENIAKRVFFVHGTSRADKEWPLAHWADLGQRLLAAGYEIALPHGNPHELAVSHAIRQAISQGVAPIDNAESAAAERIHVLPALPLAELTTELAASAGVVDVDSDVSHIAVALDLPHVQIYNVDTAWRTGPGSVDARGRQRSVFAAPTPSVDAVWQAWLACVAVEKAAA